MKVTLGRSVNGTAIEAFTFGTLDHPMIVMAAIHGDEIASAYIAKKLIDVLNAEPARVRRGGVVVIPVANPDGLAIKSRLNANKVDCNRNFPAKNFKASMRAGFRSGKSAASEPETRAIIAAIDQFKPAALISIHAITGGRECNNFDGPGEPLAKLLAQHNGYRVTPTIGYPTPGSLGSYAGNDAGTAHRSQRGRGVEGEPRGAARSDAVKNPRNGREGAKGREVGWEQRLTKKPKSLPILYSSRAFATFLHRPVLGIVTPSNEK